jgi:hypothetical protein
MAAVSGCTCALAERLSLAGSHCSGCWPLQSVKGLGKSLLRSAPTAQEAIEAFRGYVEFQLLIETTLLCVTTAAAGAGDAWAPGSQLLATVCGPCIPWRGFIRLSNSNVDSQGF